MKVNLKLLDIDGCLYHRYTSGGYTDAPHEAWLLDSNKPMLEEIERDILSQRHNRVILAYGTNRQDYVCDYANRHKGGSLAPALPILQSYLSAKLTAEVVIEPFLMADIYGRPKERISIQRNCAAGDSYRNILWAQYNREEVGIAHAEWIFDQSKISLIYAHAHRVASLHPGNAKIVIDFYDDTDQILRRLNAFFSKNPAFLPKNTLLNIIKYDGKTLPAQKSQIQGQGEIDRQYDWAVRYLSSKFYLFSGGDDEDQRISTAASLEEYHNQDHYHISTHKMEMDIFPMDNDLEIFQKMRREEIPKLSSSPDLTRQAYTTAEALYRDGLIPERLIVATPKPRLPEEAPDNDLKIFQKMRTEEIPTLSSRPDLTGQAYTTVEATNDTDDSEKLQLIKTALNQAVENYKQWYNGKGLRGSNGFFSWFRHGAKGQSRANALNTSIQHEVSFESATTTINTFLSNPSTRYHRHSFASFLLDELVQHDGIGWSHLSPNASNRYDEERVKHEISAAPAM